MFRTVTDTVRDVKAQVATAENAPHLIDYLSVTANGSNTLDRNEAKWVDVTGDADALSAVSLLDLSYIY